MEINGNGNNWKGKLIKMEINGNGNKWKLKWKWK